MNTSPFDFSSFKIAGEDFMSSLTVKLTEYGIPASSLNSDHLCFRVATSEEYAFYKKALSAPGALLTETRVNGRNISTFRLNSPFQTNDHKIPLLELPAPKPGSPYVTGFEHAEFLIKDSFETFSAKYPHLKFSEGGPTTHNPELSLKLSGGRQAKFHHLSLDRVIELE